MDKGASVTEQSRARSPVTFLVIPFVGVQDVLRFSLSYPLRRVDLVLDQAFAALATEAGLDPEQGALVREVTEVCRAATADHHPPGGLAEVMMAAGDDPDVVERQLLAVGVTPAAAQEAVSLTLARAAG